MGNAKLYMEIMYQLFFFSLQSINYTVCDACLYNYYVLNKHFTEMREDYDGKICMDLVDMVMYIIFNRWFCKLLTIFG